MRYRAAMPSLAIADDLDNAFSGLTQDELVDAPEVCRTPPWVPRRLHSAV